MNEMRFGVALGVFIVLFSFLAEAQTQFYGPGYPPPGGVGVSSNNVEAARGAGLTWSYSTFAFSDYQNLYYGVTAAPVLSLDNNPAETLTFSSGASNLAGGVAFWLGSSLWCNGMTGTLQSVSTQMILTVTDGTGAPLPLTDASTIPGFPGTVPVLTVAIGGGATIPTYNANYQMQVRNPFNGIWTPALDFYDSNHSCANAVPQVKVDLSAGFWNTDYPITAQGHLLHARPGEPFTLTVAGFSTQNPSPQLPNFTASIDWGDGSPVTPGTIVVDGSGFDVIGSHAYMSFGAWVPAVQINSIGGSTASATGNARRWPRLESH
jgi:hypothetical protein